MMDYDVKKVLQEMRSYRAGLIQTTEQLRFSYIAILEGTNMVAPEAYGAAYWKMGKELRSWILYAYKQYSNSISNSVAISLLF